VKARERTPNGKTNNNRHADNTWNKSRRNTRPTRRSTHETNVYFNYNLVRWCNASHDLVQQLGSRQLTVRTDCLLILALAGLSHNFGISLEYDKQNYLFGFRKPTMFYDLCWIVTTSRSSPKAGLDTSWNTATQSFS
jgi:hypothetical protein